MFIRISGFNHDRSETFVKVIISFISLSIYDWSKGFFIQFSSVFTIQMAFYHAQTALRQKAPIKTQFGSRTLFKEQAEKLIFPTVSTPKNCQTSGFTF